MTESKRANGEGSKPRRRKDGRFYSHYTILVDGVPKRKTVYGRNKMEVRIKLRKARSPTATAAWSSTPRTSPWVNCSGVGWSTR